jgi:hypothetical protein
MFKRTNALLATLGLLIVAAAGFAARGLVSEPAAQAQTAPTSAPAAAAHRVTRRPQGMFGMATALIVQK